MPNGKENGGVSPFEMIGHDGDRVGRRTGGRRARQVTIRAVHGRLTHREQCLFEEAVMLLLVGLARRRLIAHKERCHES